MKYAQNQKTRTRENKKETRISNNKIRDQKITWARSKFNSKTKKQVNTKTNQPRHKGKEHNIKQQSTRGSGEHNQANED